MSQTVPPNPLRLSACSECGYSLQGLPDAGACPECGTAYDQETVVLHGWARGSHANLGNASPRIVLWTAVPMALFVSLYLMQLMSRQRAPCTTTALQCAVRTSLAHATRSRSSSGNALASWRLPGDSIHTAWPALASTIASWNSRSSSASAMHSTALRGSSA